MEIELKHRFVIYNFGREICGFSKSTVCFNSVLAKEKMEIYTQLYYTCITILAPPRNQNPNSRAMQFKILIEVILGYIQL